MSTINSPFRYPGGKFYARSQILKYIPDHTHYVEPFAGGASIFFAKEKVSYNHLNDADPALVNCYIQIRDHVEELIELLTGIQATKKKHTYFKNEFVPATELEQAFRWFYLNRTSYSGIMNPPNCYWGYGDEYSMKPENWPSHLQRCSNKLQEVVITCSDFEQVISNACDNAFLFIDPPYYNAEQNQLYRYKFSEADHTRLAVLLQQHSHRLNFLLTYDNTPGIRGLYSWAAHILDKEWNYTINRTDDQKTKTSNKGKRSVGREIFIINQARSSTVSFHTHLNSPGPQTFSNINTSHIQSLAQPN